MASVAASTAAASLGVSEMLGKPLKLSGVARSAAPSSTSNTGAFKTVALFSKKKAAKPKPSAAAAPVDEELAKWYGMSFISSDDIS